MKKLLIATAALAMVAGTAQAQSNVTMYGAFDGSYAQDKRGTSTTSNDTMSNKDTDYYKTSSFGIRGTEDLGGGMTASFQWESDLFSSTGATTLGDRLSFITLSSKDFGALSIGRQNDAVKDIEGLPQVYNLSDNLHFNTLVGNRYANVTKYQSPTIGGFSFAYSFSENPAGTAIQQTGTGASTNTAQESNNTLNSYNVRYKLPFNGGVDLAYGNGKVETGAATTTFTKTEMFAAKTAIAGVTVGAGLMKNKQGDNRLDQTMISASVPFQKFTFMGHYVSNDQTGSAILTPTGGSLNTAPEGNAYGGSGFGLMAVYNLSKRTAAYVGYAEFTGDTSTGDRTTQTIGLHHAF